MYFKVLIVCLSISALANANEDKKTHRSDDNNNLESCMETLDTGCIKINIVKNIDTIIKEKSFQLFSGVKLEQVPGTERLTAGRSLKSIPKELPEDDEQKAKVVDELLDERMKLALESRVLKISLDAIVPGTALRIGSSKDSTGLEVGFEVPEDAARSLGEGRRLRHILPLIAFAKYTFGVVAILKFIFLSTLAWNAFIVSKIALVLSSILGLRSLYFNNLHHHGGYSHLGLNQGGIAGYGAHRGTGRNFRGRSNR